MQSWAHAGKELDLEALAAEERLSYEIYRRRFRTVTGTSPKQYFITLKMAIAQERLLHTALSIKEIAASLGYTDAAFFSRLFASKHGASPKQWRQHQTTEYPARNTKRPSTK
jgi:transcriptional regulator GlxA family with amidase domain